MVEAIIFDLDGVLVHSGPAHAWAYTRLFQDVGVSFSREDWLRVGLGVPRREVILSVLGDIPAEQLDALMIAKVRYVEEFMANQTLEPIPGALEFVNQIKGLGVRVAVATVSKTPRLFLNAIGALDLFECVLDRSSVKHPKPDPSVYLKALEVLEISADQALVIEDSPPGVEAASRAGIAVLALTTTASEAELSKATAVYSGFDAIPLERWLGGR